MQNSQENNEKRVTVPKKDRVTISINRNVKKFTTDRLKELGGFVPVEVYKSVRSGRGLVSKNDRMAIEILDKLLARISSFIVTVPYTSEEGRNMKDFITAWKDNVKRIRTQLMKRSQPVYYHSVVDEELAKLGSKMKCTDIHLEWYLSRFGADQMMPEEIAKAILKYNGGNWKKVRPLVKDGSITVTLDKDSDKIRKSFLRSIQWIYKIQSEVVSKDIIDKIENDLKVLKEFEAWCNKDPKDYEYHQTYEAFKARLQTTPTATPKEEDAQQLQSPTPSVVNTPDEVPEEPKEPDHISSPEPIGRPYEESKDISKPKNYTEETEDEKEAYEVARLNFNEGFPQEIPAQILILKHGYCPKCGAEVTQKPAGISKSGKSYDEFLTCDNCHQYRAWGTKANPKPAVSERVFPLPDRKKIPVKPIL